MEAGELDQRVVIERRAEGVDGLGQVLDQWLEVRTVWAKVEALRSREYFSAGQMQEPADMKVTVRSEVAGDVLPERRLRWKRRAGDVLIDIVSSPPVNTRPQWFEVLGLARVRDGKA